MTAQNPDDASGGGMPKEPEFFSLHVGDGKQRVCWEKDYAALRTFAESLQREVGELRKEQHIREALLAGTTLSLKREIDARCAAESALAPAGGKINEALPGRAGEADLTIRDAGVGSDRDSASPIHTSHLPRVWDRTCPGCLAEAASEPGEQGWLKVGNYYIQQRNNGYWIEHESGEGMQTGEQFEEAIREFYRRHF